jgi:hypothetical protein
MAQAINLKMSYKAQQIENTLKYRQSLLDAGMQELTKEEFIDMLTSLGYKIDKGMCDSYYNNLNDEHYLARSMAYNDVKTGQSWAHYEQKFTNRENQEKLQKIRYNSFVFDSGRIWEL